VKEYFQICNQAFQVMLILNEKNSEFSINFPDREATKYYNVTDSMKLDEEIVNEYCFLWHRKKKERSTAKKTAINESLKRSINNCSL